MSRSASPLRLLDLEELPRTRCMHVWADYVELRCLASADDVSRADVVGWVTKEKDARDGVGEPDGSVEEPGSGTDALSTELRRGLGVDDVFGHLEYRASVFKESYPFRLPGDGSRLIRKSRMTSKRRLYAFFLLAANLRAISDLSHRDEFTSAFERSCVAALKCYLPHPARVYAFGKSASNKGRYSGKLTEKVQRLAEDLGESVLASPEDLDARGSGDKGLDVVGWLPMTDGARGLLVMLAQCACGADEDWERKQFSSHAVAWRDVIRFKVLPTNCTFIPHCYRNVDGAWYDDTRVCDTILMDRQRLVSLLKDKALSLRELPHDLVCRALAEREPYGP